MRELPRQIDMWEKTEIHTASETSLSAGAALCKSGRPDGHIRLPSRGSGQERARHSEAFVHEPPTSSLRAQTL